MPLRTLTSRYESIESQWGVSENNRKAKYYRLTTAGRKQLDRENQAWDQMVAAIRRVMLTV